jgi:hypothetical protein
LKQKSVTFVVVKITNTGGSEMTSKNLKKLEDQPNPPIFMSIKKP